MPINRFTDSETEKLGMSATEQSYYDVATTISEKLDRIIELLERQGSIRPG